MKKLLLISTAVLGIAGASSAGNADTNVSAGSTAWRPNLMISGQTSVSQHFHNSKRTHENGGKGRGDHLAVEDSNLGFEVRGKAEAFAGIDYGYKVTIDTDTGKTTTSNLKDNYVTFKNDYGTLQAGNVVGVEDLTRGAHKIMGATGGFGGNYKNAINLSTGIVATTDLAGRTKRAGKVNYFTPRFYGLMLAVSVAPDTKQLGEAKLQSKLNTNANTNNFAPNGNAFGQNVWSGLIDFSRSLGYGFDVNLSLAGMVGKAKSGFQDRGQSTLHENIASWALGGELGYTYGDNIFRLGGEYVNNRNTYLAKSLQSTNGGTNYLFKNGDAGRVWAVAGSYEVGSHKVAYGYFESKRKMGDYSSNGTTFTKLGDAKARVHSVTYDKKMAPGFSLYAEYNHFRFTTSDAAAAMQNAVKTTGTTNLGNNLENGVKSNNGHSVIIGTKVKF